MAEIMEPAPYRTELEERRRRLDHARRRQPPTDELRRLLEEVDSALSRLDAGKFGLCAVCGDPIEPERLRADPLTCFCLDHLTADQRQDLERDLELALHTQSALLPPRQLRHGCWETHYQYLPAGPVSGDYCDLIPVAGGLFFCAGDVSGKGVAASLLMSHLHAMFRSLLSLGMPVAQVLEHANRVFCESTLPSRYATLVCGRASEEGDLELACAGHLPPVKLARGGAALLEAGGVPFGMFCGAHYSTVAVHLDPGDSLVLYTDGVTEAHNAHHEEYGVDRLLQVLATTAHQPVDALAGAVITSVRSFTAGARLSDDLTLLVLRRN